jgi:HEAT repeat protein
MLTQGGEDGRTLGALGAGFLLEPQVTAALSAALEDRSPKVVWAASLALATIGSQPALESLAYFLLHGEEGARRAAAEALALHPGEGQAALQEGSEMDDLLVRRAVVFGLARADQPWARQILEKLAVDDKEWVVRAAAALAVERLQAPTAGVPTPPRSLSETPRLIAFAAEHELGLSPGRQAFDLLLRALQEGTPAQRMAALQALEQVGEPAALPLIYQILAEGDGQLCQAAFQTLWSMAGAGLDVANPIAEA